MDNVPLPEHAKSQPQPATPRAAGRRRPALRRWIVGVLLLLLFVFVIYPASGFAYFPYLLPCATSEVPLPEVESSMRRIQMVSPTEAWVSGYFNSYLLHYKDNKWRAYQVTGSEAVSSLSMVNPHEGWAVTHGEETLIYHSGCWRKLNWQLNFRLPIITIYDHFTSVQMLSSDEGWAVGDQLVHYKDGHWHSIKHFSNEYRRGLLGLHMVSPDEGWLVGTNASIWHYRDGQINEAWSGVGKEVPRTNDGMLVPLNDVQVLPSGEGWAIGDQGVLVHRDGAGWKQVDSPTTSGLLDIEMLSADEGWIAGRDTILRYQGGKWQQIADFGATSISVVAPDEVWAVDGSRVLHYKGGQWIVGLDLTKPTPLRLRVYLDSIASTRTTRNGISSWR